MPQPKVYKDDAQRQAAYRQRKGRQRATNAELAMLARSLHAIIQTAIVHDEFPLPHELAAARPEQTMRNLMQFFDPIYDPIRNPNGKLLRRLDLIEKEEPKAGKKPL